MLKWLKWWFWDARRCEHEPGEWKMIEMGCRKIKHCTKCGKCVDLI
jgi:hypothetical protein